MNSMKAGSFAALAASVLLISLALQAEAGINPLLFTNSSIAAPLGIASYGLADIWPAYGPYTITTNEVFGYAKIDSIYAYNGTAVPQLNVSAWGVSLQQNIMLNVTANGVVYAYWLQNVADMNTSNMTYGIVDNVWNATTPNAGLSNATLAGKGNVSGSTATWFNPQNNTFYSYGVNSTSYSLPFYFEPVTRVSYNHGYPYVQFGYFVNGSAIFYDNVTFLIPNATARMMVTGYNQTGGLPNSNGSSQYYDAEFVFGGEANGATTVFQRMDSTLWIGYLAGNGSITAFPTVATFGSDTEENATDLAAAQDGGYALIRTGQPDYNLTLGLYGAPAGMTNPPPPLPPTVPTTSTINATEPLGGFGLGGGVQADTPDYLVIVIALAMLAFTYIKIKEREKRK